ncbi:MAG TPA: hypothetical protein VF005_05275 [Acidimicrobiales bacterium]
MYATIDPGRRVSVPLPQGASTVAVAVDLGAALVRLATGRPGAWKAWFPGQAGAGNDPFNFWLPWGSTIVLPWDSPDGKDQVSVAVLDREQGLIAGADTGPSTQAYHHAVGVAVYTQAR